MRWSRLRRGVVLSVPEYASTLLRGACACIVGVRAVSALYAAVIRVYAHLGQFYRAKAMLAAMEDEGLSPGLRHYDGIIVAASALGQAAAIDLTGKIVAKKGIRRDGMCV